MVVGQFQVGYGCRLVADYLGLYKGKECRMLVVILGWVRMKLVLFVVGWVDLQVGCGWRFYKVEQVVGQVYGLGKDGLVMAVGYLHICYGCWQRRNVGWVGMLVGCGPRLGKNEVGHFWRLDRIVGWVEMQVGWAYWFGKVG